MITTSDFITTPYTPDMAQAGIAYARNSWHYTYDRMSSPPLEQMRRIVAGVAVELAFRRYLAQENIPYDNLGSTPFTDPDRYDIAFGGRRCDIKSFLLIRKKQISQIRKNPGQLTDAQALVPTKQIASSRLGDEDLYVFAFLTALLSPNRPAIEKALQADQPIYLIHPLPKKWAKPQKWVSLGTLALKSDASEDLKIELGGLDGEHKKCAEQIVLNPGQRKTAQGDFHALHYLHIPDLIDGRVGVYSPALDETHIINRLEWGNIWVYGMEVIFTGYMPRGEFHQRAKHLPTGSRVLQYPRTSTPNLALPIAELYPLKELFGQAKAWAAP